MASHDTRRYDSYSEEDAVLGERKDVCMLIFCRKVMW